MRPMVSCWAMTQRRLEYMPLDELKGAPRNPKRHSSDIPVSIGRFGYTEPIVLDERTGRMVAGHGRRTALMQMRAAKQEPPEGVQVHESGQWLVPVLRGWSSRSDTEADAYLLASNRLTEAGGWENAELDKLLLELHEQDALHGLGFDSAYLTELLDSAAKPVRQTDPDELPPPGPVRVQPGELWLLGEHRIICGSSTEPAVVDRVMAGELAHICWTDPPYNLAYEGGTRNKFGGNKKRAAIANDDLGSSFAAFLTDAVAQIWRVSRPGAHVYVAMNTNELSTLDVALKGIGFHWSSTLIWVKESFTLCQKDYHAQFEAIWYGWRGDGPRLRPLEDRTQSDVWPIARPKRSDEHPTMKPVELITRALKNSSLRGDLVFEPFSGSGSTLIACEETGRRCRAVELEPKYVQVAIDRWEALTGKRAVREPLPAQAVGA
jgi:DNA modification methylase